LRFFLGGWKGEAASTWLSGRPVSERSEDILLRALEAGESFPGGVVRGCNDSQRKNSCQGGTHNRVLEFDK
jgi:hypothetical protein